MSNKHKAAAAARVCVNLFKVPNLFKVKVPETETLVRSCDNSYYVRIQRDVQRNYKTRHDTFSRLKFTGGKQERLVWIEKLKMWRAAPAAQARGGGPGGEELFQEQCV
jgi:hypothetical protein